MPVPLICPKAPCSWQLGSGSLLARGGVVTALLSPLRPSRAPGLGKLARPCLLVHSCLASGTPGWTCGGGGQRCIQATRKPRSPDEGVGFKMGKTVFSFQTLETPWNLLWTAGENLCTMVQGWSIH